MSVLVASGFLLGALNVGAVGLDDVSVNVNSKAEVKTEKDKEVNVNANANANASSSVSASAREINGWSDSDKKDFLMTVKSNVELRTGKDMENFAKGVMIKDENVTEVNSNTENVEVHYKLPAKFLGIFSASIDAITNVTFETDKMGRGPKEVTVKFPWYRRFFSLDSSVREDILQAAIDKSVQINAQYPRDNSYAQNGVTVNIISSILKGIRAKLSIEATTTVK